MDIIFGKFVTTFVGFTAGRTTAAEYRSEVNKYTYVLTISCYVDMNLTDPKPVFTLYISSLPNLQQSIFIRYAP
jgi:hypothetical protein